MIFNIRYQLIYLVYLLFVNVVSNKSTEQKINVESAPFGKTIALATKLDSKSENSHTTIPSTNVKVNTDTEKIGKSDFDKFSLPSNHGRENQSSNSPYLNSKSKNEINSTTSSTNAKVKGDSEKMDGSGFDKFSLPNSHDQENQSSNSPHLKSKSKNELNSTTSSTSVKVNSDSEKINGSGFDKFSLPNKLGRENQSSNSLHLNSKSKNELNSTTLPTNVKVDSEKMDESGFDKFSLSNDHGRKNQFSNNSHVNSKSKNKLNSTTSSINVKVHSNSEKIDGNGFDKFSLPSNHDHENQSSNNPDLNSKSKNEMTSTTPSTTGKINSDSEKINESGFHKFSLPITLSTNDKIDGDSEINEGRDTDKYIQQDRRDEETFENSNVPFHPIVDESPQFHYDDGNSNFSSYLIVMMVIVVLSYLLFHNKRRIVALIIEGRRNSRHDRNVKYHQLVSNLEDALGSNKDRRGGRRSFRDD